MIVITGVNGGIGKYLLQTYASQGETAIGLYKSEMPKEIGDSPVYPVDISSYSEVQAFVEIYKSELQEITLINCAGISFGAFAHNVGPEDWARVIEVNLIGNFNIIRSLLPIMREQNFGRIINFSSVLSEKGVMGTSAYAASKAGINGMIKSIAMENALKGITINNINLGYFNIGMINTVTAEMQEKIKETIAMKKFGPPEDIFKTVEYIRQTSYLTGSCIDLNGGLF
jgi:NAD(P)-dependent dehydrogenase (short-subunit alcohol dehydrogenase family)